MSTLSGEFIERLHNALRKAFNEETLPRMVRHKLDENLAEFTSGDFSSVISGLIDWAERQGRLPELIAQASADNPRNKDLIDVAREFVADRIKALKNDDTNPKIFPLIDKINSYFSGNSTDVGFYVVLTELTPKIEEALNAGKELNEVVDGALNEKYMPVEWQYERLYRTNKPAIEYFFKKLQKDIDPLPTNKVIPIIVVAMTLKEAKELDSGALFTDFPQKIQEDFNKLRDDLVNNGASDWINRYGETIEEWQPFKHVSDTIKELILKEIKDLFPDDPEIKPQFYDVEWLNEPENRENLQNLRNEDCIVIIDVVSMCHPLLHSKFHEAVLDVYKNTYVISFAPILNAFEKLKEISLVIHMKITNMEFTKRKFDKGKGADIHGDCEDLYDERRFGQWFEKYAKKVVAKEDGIKQAFNKF